MNNSKQPLTAAQALNRAAALCARSEQSQGDIREKLLKWGLNGSDAEQIIKQLVEQGFIDDRRYAVAFVKDRFAFNGWGRIKIAHQLRLKGIPAEVIDEAIGAIDEERYSERLIELLRAKWRTVSQREPRAAWAAMMRFAASRGFETTLSAACVKEVTSIDAQDD